MSRGLRWLIPAATSLLPLVPEAAVPALAGAVGTLLWATLPARRRVIAGNLEYLAPGSTTTERRRLEQATFRNFAACWHDTLRLARLDAPQVRRLVDWPTRHNLDAALAHGRGVVLVSPHLGGVEMSAACLAAHGYAVTALAEAIDPALFDLLRRHRARGGVTLLRPDEATLAYGALRRGEVLAIVADRAIVRPGIEVAFCGGRRRMPIGPAAFARRAGAPVVVASMVRRPSGPPFYLGVTEPARLPGPSPEEMTALVAQDFSRLLHAHPDQWFVFQPDWLAPQAPPFAAAVAGRTS